MKRNSNDSKFGVWYLRNVNIKMQMFWIACWIVIITGGIVTGAVFAVALGSVFITVLLITTYEGWRVQRNLKIEQSTERTLNDGHGVGY